MNFFSQSPSVHKTPERMFNEPKTAVQDKFKWCKLNRFCITQTSITDARHTDARTLRDCHFNTRERLDSSHLVSVFTRTKER